MELSKRNQYKTALAQLHCDHKNTKWITRLEGKVKTKVCLDCDEILETKEMKYFKFTNNPSPDPISAFEEVDKKLTKAAKQIAWHHLAVSNREPKPVGLIENLDEDKES